MISKNNLLLIWLCVLISSVNSEWDPQDVESSDELPEIIKPTLAAPPIQLITDSLTISKHFAMQFDEDLGRSHDDGRMDVDKMIELENNFIEMAELLHFIPKGAIEKFTNPDKTYPFTNSEISTNVTVKTNEFESESKKSNGAKDMQDFAERARKFSPRFVGKNQRTM